MRIITGQLSRVAAALAAVGAVTALYFAVLPVNPTTVALTYVLIVLLVATRWGLPAATAGAVASIACFNFFFLPPFLAWTIEDPQNWVAFAVFMLTAVIVSQLSGRARQRQMEAVERARSIEATARADSARRSAELRAVLLDAVAHEFKTPLTSMKAAAGELLGRADAGNRELLEIIDEDLARLQALVTDAVHMLRIDAGNFVIHRERRPLAPVVAAALAAMGARIDGHTVISRVADDLVVDADPVLLGLALRQLVDNAIKYSATASTIEIGATTNGCVRIAVGNSGSFIAPEERVQVFDRFYRGSQSRKVPGSGLGLTIVRQIVEAHGGSVTVASSPAAGTYFTLELPRETALP